MLTNIGWLKKHRDQIKTLEGGLLYERLVKTLEDAFDKNAEHEAIAMEDGEAVIEDEELEDEEFQEELAGPEPSKELKRLVMKMHQNTGYCSRRRLARALT